MGPFMVEIVFCRVTRRGRKMKKGMNKAGRENMRNDGPSTSFIPPDDTVKITLDLSENGPVFSALDEMMMKMMEDEEKEGKKKKGGGKGAGGGGEAKKALKNLLKSGIPGIEKMFAPASGPPGMKKQQKGFHKMNDGSKKKFMKAIFGEDGTAVDAGTAAALLAATCSGGDPEIGDKIAQLLVPNLGDKVDPSMMAALMTACSLINAGSGAEEVMKIMKQELIDSGMSEDEIFEKTQILMKAFGKDDSGGLAEWSLAGKQKNSGLRKINISPKEFAQIALLQRTLAACGTTPENLGKSVMIQNQLSKRGAQNRHIGDALKKLVDTAKIKSDTLEKITKSLADDKIKKEDVQCIVRMHQAIENENEPTWKEVKSMKDILQGCSPSSPEAIELNLARATKTAGLSRTDLTAALMAQKAMAAMGIDPMALAQVMHIEKVIAENGVPAVEIGRVLQDGGVPGEARAKLVEMITNNLEKDFNANDVDAFVKMYDNLRLKSNIPEEAIEHIDKTLIQVRCSLEDVADNMISSMSARGEKENVIVRNLAQTLKDTGATVEIVGTTMMGSLRRALPKTECEVMKDTGRSLTDVGFETDGVTNTMTEIMLNLLDENPDIRDDAIKACETVLKETGQFPDQIRKHLADVLPPEPPKVDPRLEAELERLRAEDEAREAEKARKAALGESDSEPEFDEDEMGKKPRKKKLPIKDGEPMNMAAALMNGDGGSHAGSRRGSLLSPSRRGSRGRADSISLAGTERRGSFYGEEVSKRSSVAIVVDDPENKKKMTKELDAVFAETDAILAAAEANQGEAPPEIDEETREEIIRRIASGEMNDVDVAKLMTVFNLKGTIHNIGGISKFRTAQDMKDTIMDAEDLFNKAMEEAKNRPDVDISGLSEESRKLMEQILATQGENEDVTARVTALLAGTGLTTTRGVNINKRDEIPQIAYDINQPKRWKRREINIPEDDTGYRHPSSLGIGIVGTGHQRLVRRRSIKRSTSRARSVSVSGKTEAPEIDDRRIVGLRRAKVPLMVYSCGGFTRCFRIARFYDVEGPPIGVTYDQQSDYRKKLNPELEEF